MHGIGKNIVSFLVVAFAFVVAFGFFALTAYAEDAQEEVPAQIDYTEYLDSLDDKVGNIVKSDDLSTINDDLESVKAGIDNLSTHEDSIAIRDAIQAITPVDNSERLEKLNTLFAGLTSIQTFQLVSNLLLIGVILALIWLVSYRSHT